VKTILFWFLSAGEIYARFLWTCGLMAFTLAKQNSWQNNSYRAKRLTGLIRNFINLGYLISMNHQARSDGRKYFSMRITGLLTLVLLSACSSGLQVRSDIDTDINFSQYSTYNFFDPMGIEGGYNSPIFGELFRESISGEMNRRGYRLADNPGILINVTIRADDKVRLRSYTAPYMSGGYYGYPGGVYGGSALGMGVATGTRVTSTTEASVFIDFVDIQKQRAVWQGVAVVDVTDEVRERLRDAIFTAVDKVIAEYPHTAGQ
jgi:hypothetical protein